MAPLSDCMQSPAGQRDQNIFEAIQVTKKLATERYGLIEMIASTRGIGGITRAMKLNGRVIPQANSIENGGELPDNQRGLIDELSSKNRSFG